MTVESTDLVGPFPGLEGDPLVRFARDFVDRRLVASAADVDEHGIPHELLPSMGPLLAMAAPLDGSTVSSAQWREVSETIMAADGTVWFCWSQHHPLVRTITYALPYAGEKAGYLVALREDLVRGNRIAGISFSHVRRPGAPALVAEQAPGGWRLRGGVDWISGWDVADVVLVLAQAGEDLVHVAIDTAAQPGLIVGERLHLMAMNGSHTRPVHFDDVFVPDERVVGIQPRATWLTIDEQITAQPNPAALGLARGAVASLTASAARRECQQTWDVARGLAEEVVELRMRTYVALDDSGTSVPDLLSLRAAGLELAMRACSAALTASGGHALMSGSDAERRYREAAFLLVQRQTSATRVASLHCWLKPAPMPSGARLGW
jgi:alkylation response protein AidB-like acyl-CoA dehydrogenase